MSDFALKVENLGKLYHIGARKEQYSTLRSALVSGFKKLVSRRSNSAAENNTLWALKDVSFEIKQGEVVGVIGRNGAGKSTLLKVLAHITEPTRGRVSLYGRVGSLLEVGTGFHPELTGRDNIYLNGAILGMKRAEIQRKFDEIVAFAEIEMFLDTPVKRYSSGMYVRLAFAVAAHLEPEILLVDEVLAVGDAQFQKKCMGKMWEISNTGRTVIFVSHNMVTINALCSQVFLLDKGNLLKEGETSKVIAEYLTKSIANSQGSYVAEKPRKSAVWIKQADLQTEEGNPSTVFFMSAPICLKVSVCFTRRVEGVRFAIKICEANGSSIYHIMNVDSGFDISHDTGVLKILAKIDNHMLYPGPYLISLDIADSVNEFLDAVPEELQFTIIQDGDICRRQLNRGNGIVFTYAHWGIEDAKYE